MAEAPSVLEAARALSAVFNLNNEGHNIIAPPFGGVLVGEHVDWRRRGAIAPAPMLPARRDARIGVAAPAAPAHAEREPPRPRV